jgi:hypothetical protein
MNLNQKNKFQNQSSLKPQLSVVKSVNSTPTYLFNFSTFTFLPLPNSAIFQTGCYKQCVNMYTDSNFSYCYNLVQLVSFTQCDNLRDFLQVIKQLHETLLYPVELQRFRLLEEFKSCMLSFCGECLSPGSVLLQVMHGIKTL